MIRYEWCVMRRSALTGDWGVDLCEDLASLPIYRDDFDEIVNSPWKCRLQLRKRDDANFGSWAAHVRWTDTDGPEISDLYAASWPCDDWDIAWSADWPADQKLPRKYRREFRRWCKHMQAGGAS